LPGLFIGIGISLLLLIYRASRPYIATLGREPGPGERYNDIDRHPDSRPLPHIAVLRIESSLYFANADSVRGRILQSAEAKGMETIVLDAETIPSIDVTAARMLFTLADTLHREGVNLLLARSIGQVRDELRSVVEDPGITRFYPTVRAAVDSVQHRI
jgi:sulfate permease, SulP family